MKRHSELYETAQPRSASSSWIRVICSLSAVSQTWICSALGDSCSSLGASVRRGPARLSAARRASWVSSDSGPLGRSPSSAAASR